MPTDLSSVMGNNFGPAESATKKLKKVGNVYLDEATGQYFTNESGQGTAYKSQDDAERALETGNIKPDTRNAPGGPGRESGPEFGPNKEMGYNATSVMESFGVEKATGTGGWAVGQGPSTSVMAQGEEKNRTPLEVPQGMTTEQKAQADSVWQQYSHAVGPQNEWYKKWMQMSDEEKKKWLDRVKNRPV